MTEYGFIQNESVNILSVLTLSFLDKNNHFNFANLPILALNNL